MSGGVLFVHSLSGELFGNHVSDDTHHGGTSVVQLNIELAGLFFRVFDVGSEVTNSVVSVVLGGRHPCELDKGEESQDLSKSGRRDGGDSSHSGGDIGELEVVRGGKVSVEDDVVVVDNGSNNGSHGNTSVLALDGSATFEGLRLGLEPSKRIVDSKGLSDTEFCRFASKEITAEKVSHISMLQKSRLKLFSFRKHRRKRQLSHSRSQKSIEEHRKLQINVPSSETLRAEEVCPCWAGAKAAAVATREAKTADFILIIICFGIGDYDTTECCNRMSRIPLFVSIYSVSYHRRQNQIPQR